METTICNPEDYKRELRLYFDKFSSDPLMKINPRELSDNELMSNIKSYSEAKANENFTHCTWVTIENVKEGVYGKGPFKFVELGFEGKHIFTLNFSQFKYYVSSAPTHINFDCYNAHKANYICTIDGKRINPDDFFPARIGQKLFLIYSFPCVDKFEKARTCYLFADKLKTPSDIRKHILFAQKRLLQDLLANPAAEAPRTTVKATLGQNQNIIQHNVAHDTTKEFARQVFEEEYRERYQKKLNELLH